MRGGPSAFVKTSADRSAFVRTSTHARSVRDRVDLRDLAERQVFREACRGEMVGAAGEQRQERTARRMRAARPAVEPRLHVRAPQRVLEQAEVALRRSHEDRHLVETDAAACFGKDAPRNLDALASFAGGGKQLE